MILIYTDFGQFFSQLAKIVTNIILKLIKI